MTQTHTHTKKRRAPDLLGPEPRDEDLARLRARGLGHAGGPPWASADLGEEKSSGLGAGRTLHARSPSRCTRLHTERGAGGERDQTGSGKLAAVEIKRRPRAQPSLALRPKPWLQTDRGRGRWRSRREMATPMRPGDHHERSLRREGETRDAGDGPSKEKGPLGGSQAPPGVVWGVLVRLQLQPLQGWIHSSQTHQ